MSSALNCGTCNLPAVCATALKRMALGEVALIAVSALALATASMQPNEDWLNKESFQVQVPFGCRVHSAVDAIGPLNAVVGSQNRTTMTVLASKWLAGHGARGGKTIETSESHESIVARAVSEEGRPQEEPMSDTRETKSLAVLIHADNTGAKNAQAIFEEFVKLGEANVQRVFGDFSEGRLSNWDSAIKSLAILQHQQRSNSKCKYASDIALVKDVMDLIDRRNFSGVMLVR